MQRRLGVMEENYDFIKALQPQIVLGPDEQIDPSHDGYELFDQWNDRL